MSDVPLIDKLGNELDRVQKVAKPMWAIVAAMIVGTWLLALQYSDINNLKRNGSDNFRVFQEAQAKKDEQIVGALTELTTSVKLLNQQVQTQSEAQKDFNRRLERLEHERGRDRKSVV